MNPKVDKISVPEASPESNEKGRQSTVSKAAPRNRKILISGALALLALAATLAIAVPLAKKNDNNDAPNLMVATQNTASAQTSSNFTQCHEPKEGDTCTTKESYIQCLDLVTNGCQKIYSTFSCPPIHHCGDGMAEILEEPPVACTMEVKACPDGSFVGRSGPNCEYEPCPEAAVDQTHQCPEPQEGDLCNTQESYEECLSIKNSGCQMIYSTFSCPPIHRCGDAGVEEELPVAACTMELRYCPDGSSVGRTGPNCEFEECPIEATQEFQEPSVGVPCTMELRYCPDGSSIGRAGPNCEFEECPSSNSTQGIQDQPAAVPCTLELKPCPDGSSVGRTGPNCEFEECPSESFEQAHECPEPQEDDPCITQESYEQCMNMKNSGCQKIMSTFSCPPLHRCGDFEGDASPVTEELRSESEGLALVACPMDVKGCEDGSFVDREGPNCEFKKCPEELNLRCSRELALCADGNTVGRAPPACTFESCADGSCPIDTFSCPNGVELKRDPNMYCEFPTCPDS